MLSRLNHWDFNRIQQGDILILEEGHRLFFTEINDIYGGGTVGKVNN